jgi:hypothetical protein
MANSKAHKRNTTAQFSNQQDEFHNNKEETATNNNMNFGTSSTMVMSSAGGGNAIRRVRTPHAHDVLSGRGGGINAHQGNVQFRRFVRARKDEYNLAGNKMEKAQVAQQVIDIVRSLDPPGRFLQKDPSYGGLGGWWVELDEDKVMAKTSQALREGAPLIRATLKGTTLHATAGALQSEPPMPPLIYTSQKQQQQSQYIPTSAPTSPLLVGRKTTNKLYIDPDTCVSTITKPDEAAMTARQELAMAELRANVEQARLESNNIDSLHHLTMPPLVTEEPEDDMVQQPQHLPHGAHVKQYSPFKRVRVQYGGRVVHPGAQLVDSTTTPPLTSADAAAEIIDVPPLDLSKVDFQQPPLKKYRRSHSLALSDTSHVDHLAEEDFVNPFEEESDQSFFNVETTTSHQPQPSNNNHHLGTVVPLDTLHHASSSAESSSAQQSSSRLQPGFYRNSGSATSNGDMAGLRSLLQSNNKDNNSSRSLQSASSGVRGYASGSSSKWERRDSFDSTSSSSSSSVGSDRNGNRRRVELDLTDPLHYFFCQTRSDGILSVQ